MGKIKGQAEYKKFEEGKPLSRKQAILAQCGVCNGFEAEDCLGMDCAPSINGRLTIKT